MFDAEERNVAVLPVTPGVAIQEPCSALSQVRTRDFGSAEGTIGALHFPVRDADELDHGESPFLATVFRLRKPIFRLEGCTVIGSMHGGSLE